MCKNLELLLYLIKDAHRGSHDSNDLSTIITGRIGEAKYNLH